MNNVEELIAALDALREDLRINSANWQNLTLEHYLESMKRWLEDSEKGRDLQTPTWDFIYDLLMAPKYYE